MGKKFLTNTLGSALYFNTLCKINVTLTRTFGVKTTSKIKKIPPELAVCQAKYMQKNRNLDIFRIENWAVLLPF